MTAPVAAAACAAPGANVTVLVSDRVNGGAAALGGDAGVVVGIDAGGSSTRARAVRQGVVLFEGGGGAGNPVTAGDQALRASYAAALAGCPPAGRVVACVSGTRDQDRRRAVRLLIAESLPGAEVAVVPDYVGAVEASPAGTDVTVICGTGSLVCGRLADGEFAISGGRGWILGDHGSATRLGQAALEWYCDDPDRGAGEFAARVAELTGSGDWRSVVAAVHSSASPAALLARAAPLLTTAAQAGAGWATERLDADMSVLAATAMRHIGRFARRPGIVHVALTGGVWSSQAAVAAFAAALDRLGPPQVVTSKALLSPLDAAVRLAAAGHCATFFARLGATRGGSSGCFG